MACLTCNHTMQAPTNHPDGRKLFWCPRCGTLKVELQNGGVHWYSPFAWPRAIEVLRRLWKYWELIEGFAHRPPAPPAAGLGDMGEPLEIPPGVDKRLEPIAVDASKILRDCDPERREKAGG